VSAYLLSLLHIHNYTVSICISLYLYKPVRVSAYLPSLLHIHNYTVSIYLYISMCLTHILYLLNVLHIHNYTVSISLSISRYAWSVCPLVSARAALPLDLHKIFVCLFGDCALVNTIPGIQHLLYCTHPLVFCNQYCAVYVFPPPPCFAMQYTILAIAISCQTINRSHAHAHDSRTHDSRTNHSHGHRASNGTTTLNSRSRRRRPQDRRCPCKG